MADATNSFMPVEDRLYGRIGAGLPDYILNDTYDSEDADKLIHWGMNRTYFRALEAQKRLCNIQRYKLPMSVFKIDPALNAKYGIISDHKNSGTHFKTYSAKLNFNMMNHAMVNDLKKLNMIASSDKDRQETWRCVNPNVVDTPDPNHSYMTYVDSSGVTRTDPWHRPDFDVVSGRNSAYVRREVCNSPLGYFSNKKGEWYPINKGKYPHVFTHKEICARSDIFPYKPMMFIAGLLISSVLYAIDENHLYLFISVDDGVNQPIDKLIHETTMLKFIEYNVPMTLLFFPWGPSMSYDGPGNDPAFIDGYGIHYNKLENLTPTMRLKKNFWMISASWRGSTRWPTSQLVTTFSPLSSVKIGKQTEAIFPINSYSPAIMNSLLNNEMDVHVEAFCMPNVENYSFVGTNRIFQIPLNGNPIPPENILLWKYTPANTTDPNKKYDAGTYEFLHYGYVILYYPNVYQIIDVPEDVEVTAMWFYDREHETENEHFTNVLEDYMVYKQNYASAIVNGTLPRYILEMVPAKVTYDYTDYERYNKSTMTDAQTYRIEKLTELMKDDPSRYEYLYSRLMDHTANRLHANPKQTVYLGKWITPIYESSFRNDLRDVTITPIEKMGRIVTGEEIVDNDGNTTHVFSSEIQKYETLDEPHLLLVIDHTEITRYSYAVWIDGREFDLKHCYTKALTTYIYLPQSEITQNSVVEIEMMRVSSHGRTVVEMDFGELDTSIKLPRDFYDVSPQNMMISIRQNTSTWKDDTEFNEVYANQIVDPDIMEAADSFGAKFFYQVASDYEMSWLLFGHNRYVDGKRQVYDEDGNEIPYKKLHEDWLIHPAFVQPNEDRERVYGTIKFALVSVVVTPGVDPIVNPDGTMSMPEDALQIVPQAVLHREDGAYVETFSDSKIYVATNLGNKLFVKDPNSNKNLVEYNTSRATFEEINYFKHVTKHYHNNADETDVSAMRLVGVPDASKKSFIVTYNGEQKVIPNDQLREDVVYVTIGEDSYVEYKFDHESKKLVVSFASNNAPLDTMFPRTKTGAWLISNDDLNELKSTLHAASPNGKQWMFMYVAFDEAVMDKPSDKNTNPVVMESGLSHIRPSESPEPLNYMVTAIDYPWCDGFYALERRRFYQYLPYGKDAERDIYITPIGCPSAKTAVDIVTKYNRRTDEINQYEGQEYYPIDIDYSKASNADKIKNAYEVDEYQYYHSTEYPNAYFSNKHVLIQNTDIYRKYRFELDYMGDNEVTISHFYDDPNYQHFRVSVNGYRMDHGTDYSTDVNAINRYIRGDKITFTFNKKSSTFLNAVQGTYITAPRFPTLEDFPGAVSFTCSIGKKPIGPGNPDYGMYQLVYKAKKAPVVINGMVIEEVEEEMDGTYMDATECSPGIVYVDTFTKKEYVYNPKIKNLVEYSPQALVDCGFTATDVLIEYMPYKSRIVFKSMPLSTPNVNVSDQQMNRPLSLKYYDIYFNGRKLTDRDVKFASPRRMIIDKDVFYKSGRISIYERCHDPDLYGNEIAMPDSMNDIIANHDPEFRKFLYKSNR